MQQHILDVPLRSRPLRLRGAVLCGRIHAHTWPDGHGYAARQRCITNTPKRGAFNGARHDYEGRLGFKTHSTQSDFLSFGSWATRTRVLE